jgi:hypothetical protein
MLGPKPRDADGQNMRDLGPALARGAGSLAEEKTRMAASVALSAPRPSWSEAIEV